MRKSLWPLLALAALGLWASLILRVTYPTATSGEPSNEVLTTWPGWGVQQELGTLGGAVGQFDIWMSSEPNADPNLTVIASLLDAESRAVLRQITSHVTPSAIPVLRTLTFPSYVVPEGQQLVLQLQVSDEYENSVSYRLARRQAAFENVMLNGVTDAGPGPLAFAHQVTTSGVRAALHGETDARIRLILALLLSGLAMLAHPRAAAELRRRGRFRARLARPARAWRRLAGPSGAPATEGPPTGLRRLLAVPWYPWPAAVVPILHFLASNPLHFTTSSALFPVAAVLAVVTVAAVVLRLVLRGWHQAAAVVTIGAVLFFAYGHVEQALAGRVDQLVLFPTAVALSFAAAWAAIRAPGLALRWAPFLNLATSILLVFQLTTLVGRTLDDVTRTVPSDSSTKIGTTSHLFEQWPTSIPSTRPDIYYIVLDGYGRHDALGDFDNSDFVNELERRGFYVAAEGTSNYVTSRHSLASSLNLAYLDDLGPRSPSTELDLVELIQNSALATILKGLGYTYVHLESGISFSSEAPLADILVEFSPQGIEESQAESGGQQSFRSGRQDKGFVVALMQSTALHPLVGHLWRPGDYDRYEWWSAERTLSMFEYLSRPLSTSSPTFVFAHIVKPHMPATFDRHGNMFPSGAKNVGFSDSHDPTVPDAFIGQLIFLNSLVLRTVDRILDNHDNDPIILISGDHGGPDGYPKHPILTAVFLPDGQVDSSYQSISSVNHFRFILDQYFNLGVGRLEDRIVWHDGDDFDFTTSAGVR